MDPDPIDQKKAIEHVEFGLEVMSLCLESRIKDKNNGSSYDTLTTIKSFDKLKDKTSLKQNLAWILVNLSLISTAIEFIYISWLHFRHDKLFESIWPKSPYSNLDDLCLTDEAKIELESSSEDYRRLLDLERQIHLLGSPFPSLIGLCTVYFSFGYIGLTCMYYLPQLIVYLTKPKLDVRDFITNELKNKSRLELKALVKMLFNCRPIELADGNRKYQYTTKYKNDHSIHGDDTIVTDKRLEELVGADDLFDWWRKIICRQLINLPRTEILIISPFIISSSLCPFIEIYLRMLYRIEHFKCQSLRNSSSVLLQSSMQLRDLTRQDDIDAYLNYTLGSNSTEGKLNLYLIESKNYVTWNFLITGTQMASVILIATFVWPLIMLLYVYKFGYSYLWLLQIERQMDDCIKRVLRYSRRYPDLTSDDKSILNERNDLLKSLTLVYLNYDSFRSKQREYQYATLIAMMQGAFVMLLALPVCFLPALAIRNADNHISAILITYHAIILNIYLLSSSIRTDKILRLHKSICRLAALTEICSMRLSPMMRLLTNQLMTQDDIMEIFAPKLFGITILYDKVVPLDVYIVLLWYITLNS